MKTELLSNIRGRREWAMICDAGDEAMAALQQFVAAEKLTPSQFAGIGRFVRVPVAWFDLDKKRNEPIEIREQVEMLSLIGNVAESDGKPSVHAHICVAKRDGSAHGRHLKAGLVRPTGGRSKFAASPP